MLNNRVIEPGTDLMRTPFVDLGVDHSNQLDPDPTTDPDLATNSPQFDPSTLTQVNPSIAGLTLADYGFSKENVKTADEIRNESQKRVYDVTKSQRLTRFELFLKDLLHRVENEARKSTEQVKEDIEWARLKSTEIFLSVAPYLKGRINQGDPANENALVFFLVNYAPWSCLAYRDIGETFDSLCAMWRGNVCLRMPLVTIPSSLVREAGGEWSDALERSVDGASAGDDYNVIVPKVKWRRSGSGGKCVKGWLPAGMAKATMPSPK